MKIQTAKERMWSQKFCQGWETGSLVTVDTAYEATRSAGFALICALDLTRFPELRRPRDILTKILVGTGRLLKFRRGRYWNALSGGNALQHCIGSGAVCYQHLVFDRTADDPMVIPEESLA